MEPTAAHRSHDRATGASSLRTLLALSAAVALGVGGWLLTRAPTTHGGARSTAVDGVLTEAARLFEGDTGSQTRHSIDLYRQALELARAQGNLELELRALQRLAEGHTRIAECHLALPYLDTQLELLRAEGRRREVARGLGHRGACLLSLGDLEGALRADEDALAIHQKLGGHSGCGEDADRDRRDLLAPGRPVAGDRLPA